MLPLLASVLFWGFLVLSSLLLFPGAVVLWAVSAPFGRRRVALHHYTCLWASLYTWLNPWWPVQVTGRQHLVRGRASVLVANHLSLVDILVLFRLRTHFTWVSKAENFRVPVIGWNMSMNAYIPLRRGDRESVRALLELAERDLRDGTPVMVFPEGTRSRDGLLRPFKTGAFELAVRVGVPVQPVVLRGTREALPRRGAVLRGSHPITVEVLPPVEPQPGETPEELAERVRALYVERVPA